MMKKNCFIFDINSCLGCMACVAGCIIENGTPEGQNLREVNGFNPFHYPNLPVFFHSLACNHCQEALCMINCPALAYTRDENTGAIIHNAERCIGCKYCTWTCPYDAPKFNPVSKIIEKCNFCINRITNGEKPACANACPVGALDFGYVETEPGQINSPGFVNKDIEPSIKIIPLKNEQRKPVILSDEVAEATLEKQAGLQPFPVSKIKIIHEWPLVLFTMIIAVLSGWFASQVLQGTFKYPEIFWILGIGSIGLSVMHLGKKFRAWRSILNVRHSWLSREIMGFSAFLGLGLLYFMTGNILIGLAGVLISLFTVVSADMIYHVTERKDRLPLHSAQIWLTSLLFIGWLSDIMVLTASILLIKISLYTYRKYLINKTMSISYWLISGLRLSILAFILITVWGKWGTVSIYPFLILLLAELIDRIEFYLESEIVTPKRALYDLMKSKESIPANNKVG